MKLPSLVLAVAFALSFSPLHAADAPTPYPDANMESAWPGKGPIRVFGWMVDNRKYFWTQREKDHGAIVFAGDSLTGNWKLADMQKAFPGLKIANRGIGGDVSRGLLFRFQEDVVDLHPRALVLCIGSNDLSAHGDPGATAQNISDILSQARQQNADLPIVLIKVAPRDNPKAPMKPGAFDDLNGRIAKLGEGKKNLIVLDLAPGLTTPDGKIKPECYTNDRLHLAAPGYEAWAAALRPAFEKLGIK